MKIKNIIEDAMEDLLEHENTIAVVVLVVGADGAVNICSNGRNIKGAEAADDLSETIQEWMEKADELRELLKDIPGEVVH